MKLFIYGIILAGGLLSRQRAEAQRSGFGTPVTGSQFLYVNPGETTCVVPEFLCPGTGRLTEAGVITNDVFGVTQEITNDGIATLTFINNYATGGSFTATVIATNGNNCVLRLSPKTLLNSYGAPLVVNQYQHDGSNQVTTYYVLVTAGKRTGDFFTILSNSTDTVTVDSKGLAVDTRDITTINILPYWSLSSLFPAAMANTAFIPTTDPSNVMSQIVISPPFTLGNEQPQQVGQSFYFSTNVNNWVSTTNPSVSAGDAIIVPGAYVYLQNTGSNNFPLYEFISGTVMTTPFRLYFTSSAADNVVTYFCLPRNSSYKISEMGFNKTNFTQSVSTALPGRNDVLIVDDGHGGVGATYFEFKNQWYSSSDTSVPVDPVFPPGTVWGLLKQQNEDRSFLLVNSYNATLTKGQPSPSLFRNSQPVPPNPAGPVNPINIGGD